MTARTDDVLKLAEEMEGHEHLSRPDKLRVAAFLRASAQRSGVGEEELARTMYEPVDDPRSETGRAPVIFTESDWPQRDIDLAEWFNSTGLDEVEWNRLMEVLGRSETGHGQSEVRSGDANLCSDCPPVGYETDRTRCEPCPRRALANRPATSHASHTVTPFCAHPQNGPAATSEREVVEQIAQWLHDETDHPESYPHHTWPETERDDGQRAGGFVKIVPKHGQEYFRAIARRLHARFLASLPVGSGTVADHDGLNGQARNPARLPDGSGDLASASEIAGDDIIEPRRQVGMPRDVAEAAREPALVGILTEVDPGLADVLRENGGYVQVIRRNVIEECANVVGNMRQSEAGLFDAKHSGQRGCDRSDALYDAYVAIKGLAQPSAEGKSHG